MILSVIRYLHTKNFQMFHTSTQKKFWLVESQATIAEYHKEANQQYIETFRKLCLEENMEVPTDFLTYHEEKLFLAHISHFVIDICKRFKPAVPMSVIGISLTYFQRFYMNTSVMEYHPRDIAYLCVYLACKVDEYNISIDQFIGQTRPENPMHVQMFIIDNELLLLRKLNFHLTIHLPYRPLEGFFIDVKASQQELGIKKIESLRPKLEKFLMSCLLTDCVLLYPPSQIALSAFYHACGQPIAKYIQQKIESSHFAKLMQNLNDIIEIAACLNNPSQPEIDLIEEKLKICFDYENDPISEMYCARKNLRKKTKEQEKNRKFQELYEMQTQEDKILAAEMTNI